MLLSISSSSEKKTPSWIVIFSLVLIVAALFFLLWERYWRIAGYPIAITDSPQLWALNRDKVYQSGTIVFLGASRTQFAIDIDYIRGNFPELNPVMLAMNGAYPLAALKNLAEDEKFSGLVVIDVDARGMSKANRMNQQYLVDYYQYQWNWNWRGHRWLLSKWQIFSASSSPQLSLANILSRHLAGYSPPFKPYSTILENRGGYLDFSQVSAHDLADWFAKGLEEAIASGVPEPKEWLEDLREVVLWVEKIQKRGGEVIFYEPPVSGRQEKLVQKIYDKALYWDIFFSTYDIPVFNYQDEPSLQDFELPDESHISAKDREQYTLVVMNILKAKANF